MRHIRSGDIKPVERVGRLFRMGRDTLWIAHFLGLPEHEVCRLLARWRDMGRSA